MYIRTIQNRKSTFNTLALAERLNYIYTNTRLTFVDDFAITIYGNSSGNKRSLKGGANIFRGKKKHQKNNNNKVDIDHNKMILIALILPGMIKI